jgi:dCMP deaminase
VAATLFGNDGSLSRTNDWPPAILAKIGTEARIGDSSGTLHAEVNCILHAPFKTEGASLAITDPCCPNCAKNIAEAGIKSVYIDHKGFQKDFAARRGDEFQDMSLRILAHAGINLYELNRKEQKITELYKPTVGYVPPEENPIEIRPTTAKLSEAALLQTAKLVKVKHDRWGCALATDKNGKIWTLVASAHPAIGYTHDHLEQPEGKYNFILEPANRILMGAARAGLTLSADLMWCSVIPTPRELVNLVGAGIKSLYIGSPETPTKPASLDAKKTLVDNHITTFKDMIL